MSEREFDGQTGGQAWTFGDNVDTDVIIPTQYLQMSDMDAMSDHTFESIRPDFSERVSEGDIIVAGRNFGCGSSREQAPAVLKALGIGAIVAKSFSRIFYRNAINLGIPVLECDGMQDDTEEGDHITFDYRDGWVRNEDADTEYETTEIPDNVLEIIEDGGLISHISE